LANSAAIVAPSDTDDDAASRGRQQMCEVIERTLVGVALISVQTSPAEPLDVALGGADQRVGATYDLAQRSSAPEMSKLSGCDSLGRELRCFIVAPWLTGVQAPASYRFIAHAMEPLRHRAALDESFNPRRRTTLG
jgi:hypothetical protein